MNCKGSYQIIIFVWGAMFYLTCCGNEGFWWLKESAEEVLRLFPGTALKSIHILCGILYQSALLWVSDITYIHVGSGFAYLSLITDAYSRKIVGFCLNRDLSAKGPLKALKMAFTNNPVHDNLIHHSDRGVQYCCDDYIRLRWSGFNGHSNLQ